MRHAVALALIAAFLALGLWRGERYFFTVAIAVAVGYAVAQWVALRQRSRHQRQAGASRSGKPDR